MEIDGDTNCSLNPMNNPLEVKIRQGELEIRQTSEMIQTTVLLKYAWILKLVLNVSLISMNNSKWDLVWKLHNAWINNNCYFEKWGIVNIFIIIISAIYIFTYVW